MQDFEIEKNRPKKVLTICPQQINIFEIMGDFISLIEMYGRSKR